MTKTYDNSDGNRIVNVGEVIRQPLEGCYDCGDELRLTRLISETKAHIPIGDSNLTQTRANRREVMLEECLTE